MKQKIKIILLFLFLMFVGMVAGVGWTHFGDVLQQPSIEDKPSATSVHPYDKIPRHDYDWEKLYESKGKKMYDDGDLQALVGIDVSKHQGDIDWSQVNNDNIDFAIIRAGYRGYGTGEISEDGKFKNNIAGANAVGIDTGVYFFSQAISVSEAEEEAQFVIDLLKDYEVKYPVVFDMEFITEEDRIRDLSMKEKTKVALAFCQKIEKAGYTPMIYGSASWLENTVFLDDISQYDLWVSEYKDAPTFPYDFKMWQYTNRGRVAGITGNVDLNLYFG